MTGAHFPGAAIAGSYEPTGQGVGQPMPVGMVKTFIADPQPIFVDGLTYNLGKYPGFRVAGTAHSLADAKRKFTRRKADLLLTDIRLPRTNHGMELIRHSLAINPRCKVAVLSSMEDPGIIYHAHRAGAHAYLLKDNSFTETVRALETLMAGGEPAASPRVADTLYRWFNEDRNLMDNKLNERELEILRLVAQGESDVEIASKLQLTIRSVRHSNNRILRKFGVNNRTKAVTVAMRNNLI
jgi:DNA-binding NarL/FixJ family response regulator